MNKIALSPGISQAISGALTWCSHRELSSKPFRSPELDPFAILDIPEWSSDLESIEAWIERKRNSYCRAVSWVNETRSELLETSKIRPFQTVDALSKNKLLVYEPLETVTDGAAEAASMGFYDERDAPPWDTWFLYADRAVFCCVPESAITRAQNGIDANPVDCIRWADWSRLAGIEN